MLIVPTFVMTVTPAHEFLLERAAHHGPASLWGSLRSFNQRQFPYPHKCSAVTRILCMYGLDTPLLTHLQLSLGDDWSSVTCHSAAPIRSDQAGLQGAGFVEHREIHHQKNPIFSLLNAQRPAFNNFCVSEERASCL